MLNLVGYDSDEYSRVPTTKLNVLPPEFGRGEKSEVRVVSSVCS